MQSGKPRAGSMAAAIGILFLMLCGFVLWVYRDAPLFAKFLGSGTPTPVHAVTYTCDNGKTITASFFGADLGKSSAPGQPTSEGSVSLVLSDGRIMNLLQTASGSGVLYVDSDRTFSFLSKGNTAFIEEGSHHDQTFNGCVTASNTPGQENWDTYASSTMGVTVRYPETYTVKAYAYDRGPKKAPIHGIMFGIQDSLWQGTNLSSDTRLSIEELPDVARCSATAFFNDITRQTARSDMGVDYFVATSSGVGAGNFYEEQVFAIQNSNPCTAVRYFVHSTNISNYDPGQVSAYNSAKLLAEFDKIRQSLVLSRY